MRELEPALEEPTPAGQHWGKPQPTFAMEEPTRAGQCWGEPQPTCAMDQASPGSGCAGGDDAARQTKPIEREKCWGKPQPATGAAKPACLGGDPPRQAAPMARDRGAESRLGGEAAAGYAKRTQSAGAGGRGWGADFVGKTAVQGQSAALGGAESRSGERSRPVELGARVSGGNG